ncbi:glycosyltransferase [Spartinivicinus ruber]|uniref:glycosyltransferase n=1 Tax=Spartinivicinus ruber TaxID=2683272 RepID=UPI0013D257D6|nr:glycosyltransferase [Spartinivicinus ruber]
MKEIYLLITDAGGGHRAHALALKKAIQAQQLNWNVRIVNIYTEILTRGKHWEAFYNFLLKSGFSWIYWPVMVPLIRLQIPLKHQYALKALKSYWQNNHPSMVVSLLPFVNDVLEKSVKAVHPTVPFITSLCDLVDLDKYYLTNQRNNHYPSHAICPTDTAEEQARQLGYIDSHIHRLSGPVLDPDVYFSPFSSKQKERQKHGLDANATTAVISFGGNGSNEMLSIANQLARSPFNLQCIFICGKNKTLAKKILKVKTSKKLLVKGFTTNMSYYLSLGDFFIGKPGPNSIGEAIQMGLPVITENSWRTMQQERHTCEWIIANQFGLVIKTFRNTAPAIAKLLEPTQFNTYQKKVANIRNYGVFEAVDALSTILNNLNDKVELTNS